MRHHFLNVIGSYWRVCLALVRFGQRYLNESRIVHKMRQCSYLVSKTPVDGIVNAIGAGEDGEAG